MLFIDKIKPLKLKEAASRISEFKIFHDCKVSIKERGVAWKLTKEFNAFKLKLPEGKRQIKIVLLIQP